MLTVYTDKGYKPVNNRSNFNIVYDYEGGQTLLFDIPTGDEIYSFLYEENLLHYGDNEFKINKINQRKIKSTVTAVLNLDDWRKDFYHDFHETYALFSEIINLVIPDGWTVEGAGTVTGRRTINLEGATPYDILMKCMSTYNIVFEYHILKKTIKVIKPDTYQSRGLYITDELNLKELEFKGDSSSFATRLYAFGKKTEEKDEEGNVTSTTYVNFASINGGKLYVDNNEYSNRIIVQYWQDDRYINPEELLNDAIDKLKELAKPNRSYGCKLIDLSRINEKYKYLDFMLYDKVTLIDSISKVHVQHQIVEYVDYPDNRNNNSVSLSSVFKKITGTIDNIKQSISSIDTELLRKESTLNEIIRDVASNTLRIQNTYTKGEVDEIEESIIQQTSDSINSAIQNVEKKIQDIDTSLFTYELQNDGTSITNNGNVTLSAHVFNKGEDVTNDIQNIAFNWIRQSNDIEGDTEWNNAHKGIKSITLTPEDVYVSGVFYCRIAMSFGVQRTQSLTINDETDIADLKNSYLDPSGTGLVQELDDTVYFPDWTTTHAVLTPCVVDGILNIDIGQCAITYKRIENGIEVALGVGETVENGVLTISKNIMTKDKTSLDYVCYVSYKNSTIKLYRSYMLNVLGQDGTKGKDGTNGVSVVSVTSYFALSSSNTIPPTSGWITTQQNRPIGQFQWRKDVTKFSDNSTTETPPYLVTGDKGDKGATGAKGEPGIDFSQGKALYKDPMFATGVNSTLAYGNGTLTWERLEKSANNPMQGTAYEMVCTSIGTISPANGGFKWAHASRANAVFIYRIIAKIPTGRSLMWASNATGTGGSVKWLTSNAGTGKYTEYLLRLECGGTGTFSTTGFFYVNGAAGTSATPLKWYVAYATVLDMTNTADVENVVRSDTAPTDTTKMWFDTTSNLLKYWDGESWEVTNDYAEDLNNVRTEITTEYNSAITQLKESITSLVEELQTTTTDNSQAVNRLASQIEQNASSISFITSSVNSIVDNISGLATKEEISKWARFMDGVLELGASNSPFAVKLSNTELGFYQNGTRIAYLSNQMLNISQAVVMTKLKFTHFEINDVTIEEYHHLILK